jgi:branched-chain amino acid transport system substrate-binding protein
MTRRSPVFASLAVLLAAVLTSAACSNPRETGGGGGGGEVSEEGPISIGASLSLSGEYARIAADQHNAYKLFVKQVNDSGGLLGRQIELTVLDDRSNPETGARLYERLITEEDVDLLMGPYSSAVTGGMMPIAERYEMVNIAPMASADELFQQGVRYSFQVITPASHYLDGALDIMEEEGLKTFVVVGEDSAFPAALLKGLEAITEERGFELLYSELYPVGTRDFSAIIQKIEDAQPDAIMGGTYAEDAIAFTRQLKELGVDAPVIALTVGAAENEYWESVGDAGQHIMGASHWEPELDTPGNDKFVKAYKAEYGKDPGYHAAGSFAGMQLLQRAVEACECFDHKKIREELIDLETETLFGVFDVDENGAQVGKIGVMVQWFNGKKKIIWPDEEANAQWHEFIPWSER